MYSSTLVILACVAIVGLVEAAAPECVRYAEWAKKPCSGDGECGVAHSKCFKGQCLCDIGFIYSVGSRTCVSLCPHFHDSYHVYPDGGVDENNVYTTTGTGNFCKGICTEDPKCMSAERHEDGTCHFHHVQATISNWEDEAKWTFFQKNCE